MTPPILLASSSPFRRKLMENAGLVFATQPADIDERLIEAGLEGAGPGDVALTLAAEKALAVSRLQPHALVIGSDQTMSLGNRVYHKPKSRREAGEVLASLSGRTHRLNSGVAIARGGEIVWRHLAHADLTMRDLSAEFIETYLDRVGDRVTASVGGYQLEAEGIQLFSAIDGDYFTILGLPMLPLLQALRELEAING